MRKTFLWQRYSVCVCVCVSVSVCLCLCLCVCLCVCVSVYPLSLRKPLNLGPSDCTSRTSRPWGVFGNKNHVDPSSPSYETNQLLFSSKPIDTPFLLPGRRPAAAAAISAYSNDHTGSGGFSMLSLRAKRHLSCALPPTPTPGAIESVFAYMNPYMSHVSHVHRS